MKKLLSKLPIIQWYYKPDGECPVQAEGKFMGHYFYFRGRWDSLTIEFAKTREDWWNLKSTALFILKKTDMYEAGYYPKYKSTLLIYKGCFLFMLYKIKKLIW